MATKWEYLAIEDALDAAKFTQLGADGCELVAVVSPGHFVLHYPATALPHRQPLLAIQSVHLLQIHALALTPQQDRQSAIAETATFVGSRAAARGQYRPSSSFIVLPAKRLIAMPTG